MATGPQPTTCSGKAMAGLLLTSITLPNSPIRLCHTTVARPKHGYLLTLDIIEPPMRAWCVTRLKSGIESVSLPTS